jgi:hypothetical protein
MHSVPMASQPRHCRKSTLACSGCSVVTNEDARLMVSSWHQKKSAEKRNKVNLSTKQVVGHDLLSFCNKRALADLKYIDFYECQRIA